MADHVVLTVRRQQKTNVRHNSEQGMFSAGEALLLQLDSDHEPEAILYLTSGKGALLVKEGVEDDVQHPHLLKAPHEEHDP